MSEPLVDEALRDIARGGIERGFDLTEEEATSDAMYNEAYNPRLRCALRQRQM